MVADISTLFSCLDVVSRDNLKKYFLHYINKTMVVFVVWNSGRIFLRQPEQPEEFAIDDHAVCWLSIR